MHLTKKLYLRKYKNKIDSIETGHIISSSFLSLKWSRELHFTTFLQLLMINFYHYYFNTLPQYPNGDCSRDWKKLENFKKCFMGKMRQPVFHRGDKETQWEQEKNLAGSTEKYTALI